MTALTSEFLSEIRSPLKRANQEFTRLYPGESDRRQPVHTMYGGAQLFTYDVAVKNSQIALKTMADYAPDARTFAQAFGWVENGQRLAPRHETVYSRVMEKLKREATEDFRIDFEDGYGNRPDPEEDRHAELAAREVARGMKEKCLPQFIGIRIKPFIEELAGRSIRTLDLFVSTLLQETGGKLPSGFVITLPKVQIPEQVTALAKVLAQLEAAHRLAPGTLKLEIMVETTQSVINQKGEIVVPSLISAAGGRCLGAHLGTYDYTASCSVTASHQAMDNPVCDFAKHVMQVSLGGTGVMLSDGATNVMPVGPHRATEGSALTAAQIAENREVVHRAWRLSYGHIRHSLATGYYQGWDLHPAQLPVRFASVIDFFLESLGPASIRLKNFVEKAAQATLVGDVFDDAATGQGLLNFFLRGINCGAITEDEARGTGLTLEEIRGRSFLKILNQRRG